MSKENLTAADWKLLTRLLTARMAFVRDQLTDHDWPDYRTELRQLARVLDRLLDD